MLFNDYNSLQKANDETSSTSDAESPTKQGPSSPGSLVDGDTSVITNHSRKGKKLSVNFSKLRSLQYT
jgi:hypothetical protein